ncbi:hypothetical protein [Acidipila sp. EB88]|uniref:hypothetical protein n=1 Tax=Acidipila sp. EB88 TaxID=2305226 RepID=UPI000F5DC71F|nr:hypothetical protein [Acidipila sp. EB88]RRA48484.1 hypothetical protein D1Y84_09480 [Acidipila sp. EB88]
MEPRQSAALLALVVCCALVAGLLWRARFSRHPLLLYTCAGCMVVLHAVWIVGLLTSQQFETGFATLDLLCFPWSFAVTTNQTMAGFGTLPDLVLNYARFVLGFGGLQCLLAILLVWEMRLGRGTREAR